MLKKTAKKTINLFLSSLERTSVGRYIYRSLLEDAMQQTSKVSHNGVDLQFTVPNLLNKYRVDSFSVKEPETLEWIDGFEDDSVLWDVGANVGLYSCYAAKLKDCSVLAFEPSVFNLELLARNTYINNLINKITIFPLPLSNESSSDKLNMTTTQWGGALSTFGQEYGQDGEVLEKVFEFQTCSIPMDRLCHYFRLPEPDYIKMDVDGIEHLILQGGQSILKQVKSILIEINDDFIEQSSKCSEILQEAGLNLVEKRHSEILEGTNSYNQIWSRS